MKKVNVLMFLLLLLFSFEAKCQKEAASMKTIELNKNYHVEMQDGSEYLGKVMSVDSAVITLESTSGSRTDIPLKAIRKMQILEKKVKLGGDMWIPNPHYNRYLLFPSAFNLEKGEGYYQNIGVFFNFFNYGITDHLSVGGGFEFISLFYNINKWSPTLFLNAKTSYTVAENLNVGAGLSFCRLNPLGLLDSDFNHDLEYGMITYGNKENNVTFGLMNSFLDPKTFDAGIPVTLSGMFRIAKKLTFVTENWLFPAKFNQSIYSCGIRVLNRNTLWDFACYNNADLSKIFPLGIPYIDFVAKF